MQGWRASLPCLRLRTHPGLAACLCHSTAAVRAAQRYIPDRRLPDSAIDVIDEAAARARLHSAAAAAAVAAAAQAQAAAAVAAAAAGQQGDPPLDAGGQSFAETRRLMEWLDSQQLPAAGQQGRQQQLGGLAAQPAQRWGAASTALGANAANALSCPHCGTPAEPPEDSGGRRLRRGRWRDAAVTACRRCLHCPSATCLPCTAQAVAGQQWNP